MSAWGDAYEWAMGTGAVDSSGPDAVVELARKRITDIDDDEWWAATERADWNEAAERFDAEGHPKWADAIRHAAGASQARDDRHTDSIQKAARDTKRDTIRAARKSRSLLPVALAAIVAAIVVTR
ncbi:MAG: hypothetical protein RI826_09995 [Chlorobium phaeovibrioides]|nr:hypothetical protein [Chlorobium phaeovibrioides]